MIVMINQIYSKNKQIKKRKHNKMYMQRWASDSSGPQSALAALWFKKQLIPPATEAHTRERYRQAKKTLHCTLD